MKIWFDADNAPHVLVMRPIAGELERRGHTVVFTARNRAYTCELLDMYGLDYVRVGGEYGRSSFSKVIGTLRRAIALKKAMKSNGTEVSFGHGSRALPIASRMLKIPSITMYDYEWVNPSIFNRFCERILLPEVISPERCREAGINLNKVRFFPGYKENLYLNDVEPDPSIAKELGLKRNKVKILLRPPATTAHYHNPEAERILDVLLERILSDSGVQLIWLARTSDQNDLVSGRHRAEVITPKKTYPGPQLIMASDVVIGGGGTMTREAAILGVRSLSFFRGKQGVADKALCDTGKLILIEHANQVKGLSLESAEVLEGIPGSADLISVICQSIVGD